MSSAIWRVAAGFALALCSCSGGGQPSPTPTLGGNADRQALLLQAGSQVIYPTLQTFLTQAQGLSGAATGWSVAVVEGGEKAAALEQAQGLWLEAMGTWQLAEVFQVGPAGPATMVTGGAGLRDEIYSWPTTNPCKIDQVLATGAFEEAGFIEQSLVNAYGLDALEYLLFNSSASNACPGNLPPNSDGAWQALSADELERRRSAYAGVVAAGLVASAQALVTAWDPAGGAFLTAFTTAGQVGSPFGSAQQALDELFAAMFYIDLDTKDMKLANPAGLSPDCPTEVCPDLVESPFARVGGANVVSNLKGFQALYRGALAGGGGAGFEALLVAMGASDLAETLGQDIDLALTAAQGMPSDLAAAVQTDIGSVQSAYTSVKVVTDLMKSQLVTVLNLTVPDEGAGDND